MSVGDGTNPALLDTTTPDLLGTDLGGSISTNSINIDDGLGVASSTCSASSDTLGRRDLKICPDKRPDLEYEIRFDKINEPFILLFGNPTVCRMFPMVPGSVYPICDSGVEADRIPTSVPGDFDLDNASPCNG